MYSFHWKELALAIQIPHPTQVRLKLPTPRKAMSNSLLPRHQQHSLQMPVSFRGQEILKFRTDWCISCREFGRIWRFSSLMFFRSLMRVFTRQCKQTHILIFPSIYDKGHSGAMRYRPPDPLCLVFDPSVRRWLYGNIIILCAPHLVRDIRKVDDTIHWINHYPADVVCFVSGAKTGTPRKAKSGEKQWLCT